MSILRREWRLERSRIGGGAQQISKADIVTAHGLAYSFGPSLQWNFLNYGCITNNVRAQDARTQALLVDYQNTVLKAQEEVENGVAAYTFSRQQAEFLRASVTAATGALDLAFLQYQQGLSDFTTVLSAEQNLLDAENNLAVPTGNIATSVTAIYRSLGGGWEIRDGKDFLPVATREEMRKRTDWGSLLPAGGEQHPAIASESPAPIRDQIPQTPIW